MRNLAYAPCSRNDKLPQVRQVDSGRLQVLSRMRCNNIVEGIAMSESRRQLLTIGASFVIFVVAILLVATAIIGWDLFVPVILVLLGVWMMALAAMRGASPQKYERSMF